MRVVRRRLRWCGATIVAAFLAGLPVAVPPAAAVNGGVSIAATARVEGNTGTPQFSVGLAISGSLPATCDVNWSITALTATLNSDYTVPATRSVTFGSGSSGTVNINVMQVVGDIVFEADETVRLTLVHDTDATVDCAIDTATAVLTITNDDPVVPPTISVADATFLEGDGNGHVEPVVITSSPTGVQVACEVNFALFDGTALVGSDYQIGATGGQMNAGDLSVSMSAVRVFGDTVLEADETLTLRLVNDTDANPDCPIGDDTATITIEDDDTANEIRRMVIADVAAVEGTGAATQMVFTLQLDGPANGDETVRLDTVAGTATSGTDYTPMVANVVSFSAGQTTTTVSVGIVADSIDEANETFTLVPSNQQNMNFGPHHIATGQIQDDDGNPFALARVDDLAISEGNAGATLVGVTVRLDGPALGNETLTIVSADGTAVTGDDFVALDRQIAFTAGQTTRTVVLTLNGDTSFETDETLTLNLTNPQNVAFSDAVAQVTILNDDADVPPSVPNAPTNLVLTSVGPNVNLSWTDASGNESLFEIQRARWVAGTWSEFVTLPAGGANQTSANDANVTAGLYAYLVRATNPTGSSDWLINVVQHSTATTLPTAPTNLVVTNSNADVVLSWSDSNTTEYVFEVGRARFDPTTQTWGEWVFFLADRDATGFTDTSVPDGQYAYLVRADNAIGASPWTIAVATHVNGVGVPAAPTGLSASAAAGTVSLTWTDIATNEIVYEIQRARLVSGEWTGWTTFVLDKNSTAFTNPGVAAGHYAYLVRATNPTGSSDWVTVEQDVA